LKENLNRKTAAGVSLATKTVNISGFSTSIGREGMFEMF
jgi:hypothetical protein